MGKALIYMLPKFALHNLMQRRSADAKLTSELLTKAALKQPSYLAHLWFYQLRVVLPFAASYLIGKLSCPVLISYGAVAHYVCVSGVAAFSEVLQIVRAIIRSDCVFVVHLMQRRTRAYERLSYKSVDEKAPLFVLAIQRHAHVSNRVRTWFKGSRFSSVRSVAPDSSEAGNGIQPFVASDFAPFFGFKFFSGKFWNSQGVNLQSGLALIRLACGTLSHARAVCILARAPQQERL